MKAMRGCALRKVVRNLAHEKLEKYKPTSLSPQFEPLFEAGTVYTQQRFPQQPPCRLRGDIPIDRTGLARMDAAPDSDAQGPAACAFWTNDSHQGTRLHV